MKEEIHDGPPQRWRAEKGKEYWFIYFDINLGLIPLSRTDLGDIYDNQRFAIGNYFRTKEDTECAIKKVRAVLKGADVIEGGCIVIHTERCPDAQTEEIADAISDFLTEKFPDYAKTILN